MKEHHRLPSHTRIVSNLTYVRVRGAWCYVCPLINLCNREVVGYAAGAKNGANMVKAAFATSAFPPFDTDAFHADGGLSSTTRR